MLFSHLRWFIQRNGPSPVTFLKEKEGDKWGEGGSALFIASFFLVVHTCPWSALFQEREWVVRHSASLSVSLSFPAGVTQCAWGAFSCLSSRWGYPFSFESLRTSSRCFLWAAGEVHRSQSSVWRTSHLVEWGNHWEALGGRRLQGACILRNIIKGTNEKWRNNHALFRVWTMPWVPVWNER